MRKVLTGLAAVVLLVSYGAPSLGQASPPSIVIDSVAGQKVVKGQVKSPLSGQVEVLGRASLSGTEEGAPPARPLVADAGDTPLTSSGTVATLLGAGFGGTEPYTFSWSTPVGTLQGADSPTAQLDTTGVAAGTYQLALSVSDSAGATANDTVKVVVYEPVVETLIDETSLDLTPGAFTQGPDGTLEFPFEVARGTTLIEATLTYTVPTNDYDLRILDPGGTQRGAGTQFVPNDREDAAVPNPEAGTWKAVVENFLTTVDQIRLVVKVTRAPDGDPRPDVSAGGPYRFALGDPQALTGMVTGGTEPVQVGWDLDQDGAFETPGAEASVDLAEGRHLVTLKATDANGLERRQTTSVLVADRDRLAAETTPITVIGINDSGINPYHLEFSATTYPDPDVLALTGNFTTHPSAYIPGYPADAEALPITLGEGYFPPQDEPIWHQNDTIKVGKLYWFPGTKIIGAIDAGGSTGVTSGTDGHAILDDNGHGSGSASVSTGNRYGYCPTCLLVVVEALDETVVAQFPWVDISSNSFGYVGGAPVGPLVGPNNATRDSTERGQLTLFAAGNGVGNAFDVPIATYGSDQTGNDWTITVGAIRRDNQRAIVGDGIPVHISAWGDGNLPSACRTGTVSQCAFGGTSAATPYTAGVFGTVLTEVRRVVGDGAAGQKPGQVVAEGLPVPESVYLADGKLTRAELREVVLRTAEPLNQANEPSIFPYPLTAPYLGEPNVLFEGYGAATPNSAQRAVDVLLGRALLPDRSFEDQFFAIDRAIRDTLYGGYDRDGDGDRDSDAIAGLALSAGQIVDVTDVLDAFGKAAGALGADLSQAFGENAIAYYLHRRLSAEPGVTGCGAGINEVFMDRQDSAGDIEPCYESRITTTVAAFRPIGIFPAADTLDAPLPAGSTVNVTLFVAQENTTILVPTGVLMAGDRELGRGQGAPGPVLGSGTGPGSNVQGVALPDSGGCVTLGELCWWLFEFSFDTTRHAFTGERLTFQVQLLGSRAFAWGMEGQHASKIAINPAPLPATGLEFGATILEPADGSEVAEGDLVAGGAYTFPDLGEDPTGAGDHPAVRRIEISVDDLSFASPIEASLDPGDDRSGTWSAPLGSLSLGQHTVYARALRDGTSSEVAQSTFTVVANAEVQWQVVPKNASPAADAWQEASGLEAWSFSFDTEEFGNGPHTVVVRLVEGGVEVARASARVKLN